ncbi:hypothetical protein [Pajaroellobacter abortibovis]|uniref:YtkA-like domain-containing protein n=1 Tax=Pajaroellobacter abortibovis TaxID=1882918 RepID=A0A1L6MYX4_9BACT|nr:hypothetical protein [Pajaroellobacter abortibovis]APS00722.1 hypothetical protein BCY86_08550 [Pajaroellobacter abortibovis]
MKASLSILAIFSFLSCTSVDPNPPPNAQEERGEDASQDMSQQGEAEEKSSVSPLLFQGESKRKHFYVELRMTPSPLRLGDATAEYQVTDFITRQPVNNLVVEMTHSMVGCGCRPKKQPESEARGNGKYQVAPILFHKAGLWLLHARFRTKDLGPLEDELDVRVRVE